jgi:hypothetical protein
MTTRPRIGMCLTLLLGLASGGLLAQVPADLQQAMQERDEAVFNADSATWDRLTADEFTVVDPSGRFMTKAERLGRLMAPAEATPLEHVQIRRYGDIYVRRFLTSGLWVLDIWVREPGGWRVVAIQATPAKK